MSFSGTFLVHHIRSFWDGTLIKLSCSIQMVGWIIFTCNHLQIFNMSLFFRKSVINKPERKGLSQGPWLCTFKNSAPWRNFRQSLRCSIKMIGTDVFNNESTVHFKGRIVLTYSTKVLISGPSTFANQSISVFWTVQNNTDSLESFETSSLSSLASTLDFIQFQPW